MLKRWCGVNPKLKTQFPFSKKSDETGKVPCTECKSIFLIKHGEISGIKQHIQKRKHILARFSSSNKLTSFSNNKGNSGLSDVSKRISAEEGIFAFHTIMYNNLFRSMNCTSSLINYYYKNNHDKKFPCTRTKCE